MPQLDILTFGVVNIFFFIVFWIYFSVMYVAVSYTMQKVTSGIYFKFYMLLTNLILVNALLSVGDSSDENGKVGSDEGLNLKK